MTTVLLAGGNPQIAKGDGDAPVRAYIAAMPGWKREVGTRLDALIAESLPGVRKAVRWNSPFYGSQDGGWLLSFHCFAKYVKVTFFCGSLLRPLPPGESKQDNIRYLDIHEGAELDEARFSAWVRQASKLPGWGKAALKIDGPTRAKQARPAMKHGSAAAPTTVDEYIGAFSPKVQRILRRVRRVVREAAPEARELISYRMPALKQGGVLVYFAAFTNHIGLYPPVRGDAALEKALAPYRGENGNLRFPYDEPIPYGLIARATRLRLKQDLAKASTMRTTKTTRGSSARQ